MYDILYRWADDRGYRAAWYDGEIVRRAFERIFRLQAEGAFDAGFFEKFLSWMSEPGVQAGSETKTLVLVAIPRPAHILTFEDGGRPRDLILPPTYVCYNSLFDEVLADLSSVTGDRLKLRLLKAPLKTIAGLTGFARYGKNNIAYVDGLGSCVQLVGFATEASIPDGPTPGEGTPRALDECRSCRACLRACPTKALADDRFLFHGERCLTGFSEFDGELPEEFASLRTPTLIGCLACQECCPVNRSRLRFERLPCVFSSEETAYLLGERGGGPPSHDLTQKIRSLGCTDITITEAGPDAIFRRNLRAAVRTRP
jgi:epoxyqueuosine reductase